MRVLIVGAGIAGLAAARALLDAGYEVTVVERAPALRRGGGAITVWGGGRAVLDDLGVGLVGAGQRLSAMEGRTASGRTVLVMDLDKAAVTLGAETVVVPRDALLDALTLGVPEGVVRFQAGFDRFEQDEDGVRVWTDDGAVHEADLLIGADGVNSGVRAALFGENAPPVTGVASLQGLIAAPVELGTRGLIIMGGNGYMGLSPAGHGMVQWFCDVPWPPPAGREADLLGLLTERYGRWASPVPELLAALAEVEVRAYPHHRLRVPREWGRGRCVLLGDAAHAMPPTLALGANQALEDVWVLRRALAAGPATSTDPAAALRVYGRERRRQARRASMVAARSLAVSGPGTFAQRETPMRVNSAVPAWMTDRAFIALHRGISNRLKERPGERARLSPAWR